MAKEKFNMGNLALPAKPQILKSETAPQAEKMAEKAVETIHPDAPAERGAGQGSAPQKAAPRAAAPPKTTTAKPKKVVAAKPPARPRLAELPDAASGELRKISLDLPVEWFKHIKFHCVEHDITMREFLMEVIERDLKKRGAN